MTFWPLVSQVVEKEEEEERDTLLQDYAAGKQGGPYHVVYTYRLSFLSGMMAQQLSSFLRVILGVMMALLMYWYVHTGKRWEFAFMSCFYKNTFVAVHCQWPFSLLERRETAFFSRLS